MPLRFIFDKVEGARVRNTIQGLEIVRRVLVLDVPKYSIATAHRALTDIIKDPQCPILRTAFPDPTTHAYLEEHQLVAIEQAKRRVELDLVYRALPIQGGGSDQIVWTVQDQTLQNHVTTYATAGGLMRISTWYKSGQGTAPPYVISPGNTSNPTNFGDSAKQSGGAPKITGYRGLRVTGRAQRAQWFAMRKIIRAAKDKINSDTWGTYPRGTWLFMGPNTSTIDRGNNYDIELTFLGEDKGHFPIVAYIDPQTGHLPADISSEKNLRSIGLPVEGGVVAANGLTLASEYEETTFSDKFNFDPDKEPNPS